MKNSGHLLGLLGPQSLLPPQSLFCLHIPFSCQQMQMFNLALLFRWPFPIYRIYGRFIEFIKNYMMCV